MSSVVFLRGVNVGRANRCQPALIAKELAKFDVVNIGAVGTFVVREQTTELILRAAFAKKLPFKCEIVIVPAKAIVDLVRSNPFANEASTKELTHFVSVLAKTPRKPPQIPLSLPNERDWLLKIIALRKRFVLGVYRRQMKAIGYLGKIDNLFGAPATTRSWNTIVKVAEVIRSA